jgi:hypothetical protein
MSPLNHDRDRYGVFDLAHRRPVGAAFVELAARAAMDGDKPHARSLRAPRQLGGVMRAVVPTKPHLQRHRHAHHAHHGIDQGQRMIEIAHQRRAGSAVDHVLGRAPHIDVDDVGAETLGDARAFGHPARFAAGELHHVRT